MNCWIVFGLLESVYQVSVIDLIVKEFFLKLLFQRYGASLR